MSRKLMLLALALLMATFVVGRPGTVAAAPAAQAGPQTWTVLVGAQAEMEQTDHGMAGAWQLMRFYPDHLTINAGDTVVWKLNAAEFHEVVFPAPGQKYVPFVLAEGGPPPVLSANPQAAIPSGGPNYDGSTLVSSGNLDTAPPAVQEFRLTFTKAGSYDYLCPIHSSQLPSGQVVGMTANITVQAAGSAMAMTPAQVADAAKATITADANAAMAQDTAAKQVPAPETMPNGTMLYYGKAGYDAAPASYMRFAPTNFTIHAGDTIEWQMGSTETPHTVTLPSGGKEPDLIVVQPQASGPPKLLLNPQILAPGGGSTYAGQGFFNSGFMSGTKDPAPGPRTYRLTFSTPGTYEYICMLHDLMGMVGHVTVLAATSGTPGMPSTGQPDAFPFAAGLGALALLLGGALVRRAARPVA